MQDFVKSNIWTGARLLIKAGLIVTQLLLLLIPAYYIKQLVLERQDLEQEAVQEITSHWAGDQTMTGPVLVLPFTDSSGGAQKSHKIYVLPDSLTINGEVLPQNRHRGLYEVMLYETSVQLTASFSEPALASLDLDPALIDWSDARLLFDLADGRGWLEESTLRWNGVSTSLRPSSPGQYDIPSDFEVPVTLTGPGSGQFSGNFRLRGSGKMLFSGIAQSNRISLQSTWKDPSFQGEQLPQYSLSEKGFRADWRLLSQHRIYPRIWKDQAYTLHSDAVGVSLFIPVNTYQQVLRSVKYAALVILLTFVAFFLIETISRQRIHALHYGLVGAALIIFYSLLLSLSEHLSFWVSYLIASVATVLLIGWFTKRLLLSTRWAAVMAASLSLLYGYLFTLLQLEDYSLLLGSIGLFVMLAITMGVGSRLWRTEKEE